MTESGLERLKRRLSEPLETIAAEQLLPIWRHQTIRIVARRPSDFEENPELATRVRGAWGRALLERPPPVVGRGRRDPFERAAAADVFLRPLGKVDTWTEIAKPYSLHIDAAGDRLDIRLHLFGIAGFWANDAREALLAALAGGVSIRPESRHRVALVPLECFESRVEGVPTPPSSAAAVLDFVTPLSIRRGQHLSARGEALFPALAARLRALAPWFDARMASAPAAAWPEANADALNYQAWTRHSARQRDRAIPMAGWLGPLRLTGALAAWLPHLRLAEIANVGSHAALGLGRYRLSLYPF